MGGQRGEACLLEQKRPCGIFMGSAHEGEVSNKEYIALPKTVTRSFGWGPNHSVTQMLTKSTLEKGRVFMFSLVSDVLFSDVLKFSPTELKVW